MNIVRRIGLTPRVRHDQNGSTGASSINGNNGIPLAKGPSNNELESLSRGRKRGGLESEEEEYTSILKRCRISLTPGEIRYDTRRILMLTCALMVASLRLQKDIAKAREIFGVQINITESSNSVVVTLPFSSLTSVSVDEVMLNTAHEIYKVDPSADSISFLVTVSKYYPHVCPEVRCLSLGFSNGHISSDGAVYHPLFGAEWSAIMSLQDVINSLVQILEMPVDYVPSYANSGAVGQVYIAERLQGFSNYLPDPPLSMDDAATDTEVNSVAFNVDGNTDGNEHMYDSEGNLVAMGRSSMFVV
jgi:ubiquitin-protein ligase